MTADSKVFGQWAIVEMFGHRRLAGFVTTEEIGGATFFRIDVPGENGFAATQYYSPSSVYCLTPTTEEIACAVAASSQPEPVHRWELAKLEPVHDGQIEEDDDDDLPF